MATSVRFYDAAVVNPSNGAYNDGTTATGAVGKGRFVLTVDPFTAPSGTDGQFDEFDFVVDDPGDSTMVFWGDLGVNVAASPALVTGGFTFDAAAPAGFDYWYCYRDTKANYDAYVAANLVAGATNYARNNAIFYDGTYHIQGLGFVVPVHGASAANWWTDGVLPPSDTPVITAPAGGSSYTPGDDLTVTVTWTEASQTDYDLEVVGLSATGTGIVTSGALTDDLVFPYPQTGAATIQVRAKQTGKGWSAFATVTINITADVDTPVSCIEAELLLDTPLRLWLPRHTGNWLVDDLSGANDPMHALEANTDHGSSTADAGGGTSVSGTTSFTVNLPTGAAGSYAYLIVHGRHFSHGSPTLVLPAGWTVLHEEYIAESVTVMRSWHVAVAHDDSSASVTAHFSTAETHDYTYVTNRYTNLADTLVGVGSANVAAGVGTLTVADLDGSASPADTGIAFSAVVPGSVVSTVSAGWGVLATTPNAETLNAYSKVPWVKGQGSAVTFTRSTTTGPWFGLNFVILSTLDKIDDETSGICDPTCVDVNYAIRAAQDDRRIDQHQVLSSMDAWTAVLVAGIDQPFNPATDDGHTTFQFTVDDSPIIPSTLGISYKHVEAEIAGSTTGVSLSEDTPLVHKQGCSTLVAIVCDPTAGANLVSVFIGARRVTFSGADPGAMPSADGTGFPIRVNSGPKGNWSLAALFDHALPRKRLLAYASHVCRCPGGFLLGTTSF